MLSRLLPSLLAVAVVSSGVVSSEEEVRGKRPNVVLILTDDQTKETLSEPRFLPHIHKRLVDQGVYYENFFAPVSVCCPSRVSLLRAQYAHNHNITFVSPPWGGWDVFNKYGYVGETLPDFLQQAGYQTYYTGKLMNDHTEHNCESLPVSGFTSSDFLVDPYTYDYWRPGFSRDNGPVVVHENTYSTDLVKAKALAYIDDALADESKPFFLGIAPIAPHSWLSSVRFPNPDPSKSRLRADIPAYHPRHANLFPTEQVPRTENFNPDEPTGVSWVKDLPKLNSTQEAYLDDFYRGRLRALQAVDELVEEVVDKLEKAGQLDNTYIFYTSDNGYALGSHRRQPGKTLGYEEDIHVPLIIRGPNVPRGKVDGLSSYGMVDLSRTILEVAGAKAVYEDDGVKIEMHQTSRTNSAAQLARHSLSEYWVLAVDEGVFGGVMKGNNTYRTLRVHDEHDDGRNATYSYSIWCTGERELYDLERDPYQVRNLLKGLNAEGPFASFDTVYSGQALDGGLQRLLQRLDALALVLKTCIGSTCGDPYAALFPNVEPSITTLSQALNPEFDGYFEGLPKVRFSGCHLGYQARLEKPEWEGHWAFRTEGSLVFQQ